MAPFKSIAQSKAAFSGALGEKMKSSAKEWASKTNYKVLPKKISKSKYVSKARKMKTSYMGG